MDRTDMSEVNTDHAPEFFLQEIHISCVEGPLENHFHRTFRSFLEVNDFLNTSGNIKPHRLYKISYAVDLTDSFILYGSLVITHVDSEFYEDKSMNILNHCKQQAQIELSKIPNDDVRIDLIQRTIDALANQKTEIPIYDPASL